MTSEILEQHQQALAQGAASPDQSARRGRAQCAQLVSDMQAFKAANPRAAFADFLRWHSPRDWKDGQFSARMAAPGNLWLELWSACAPLPASRQRLLFDHCKEAEKTLFWFEDVRLCDFFDSYAPRPAPSP